MLRITAKSTPLARFSTSSLLFSFIYAITIIITDRLPLLIPATCHLLMIMLSFLLLLVADEREVDDVDFDFDFDDELL